MTTTPTPRIDSVDRAAFERAVDIVLATVRWRGFIEAHSDDSFEELGLLCVALCQDRALRLRPWQPAPCADHLRNCIDEHLAAGDDGIMGHHAAARVAKRLLDLGLSVFEPDPLAAIEAAEAERVA
jgi:hypothetical protein